MADDTDASVCRENRPPLVIKMKNIKEENLYKAKLLSIGINPYTKKVEDEELYLAYIKENGLEEYNEKRIIKKEFKSI
jgi:3'-phosphoadenosine 5'-phosphosulfate sulfotransferase (PAPS reductase)/FAD synthetase